MGMRNAPLEEYPEMVIRKALAVWLLPMGVVVLEVLGRVREDFTDVVVHTVL